MNRFAKCDTCAYVKRELGKCKDTVLRKEIIAYREEHLSQQK